MNIFGKRSRPASSESRNRSAQAEGKTGQAQAARSDTSSGAAQAADQEQRRERRGRPLPWYAGQYKDVLLYLLIAVFFVELIVGGVAFFYGLMRAAPLTPGGPPMARFPWLGWAAAAVLAPVGLLLIVHLIGSWISHTLNRDQGEESTDAGADVLPERLRRFYAIIRNAPTVVVLVGILLLGAGLFFVDGALSALVRLGGALTRYIPWLAGSAAALLAVCYLGHRWFVYRQRRLDQEYAYRREVLERTGIVLVDKGCVPLPRQEEQRAALAEARIMPRDALPPVLDVESTAEDDATAEEKARPEAEQAEEEQHPETAPKTDASQKAAIGRSRALSDAPEPDPPAR